MSEPRLPCRNDMDKDIVAVVDELNTHPLLSTLLQTKGLYSNNTSTCQQTTSTAGHTATSTVPPHARPPSGPWQGQKTCASKGTDKRDGAMQAPHLLAAVTMATMAKQPPLSKRPKLARVAPKATPITAASQYPSHTFHRPLAGPLATRSGQPAPNSRAEPIMQPMTNIAPANFCNSGFMPMMAAPTIAAAFPGPFNQGSSPWQSGVSPMQMGSNMLPHVTLQQQQQQQMQMMQAAMWAAMMAHNTRNFGPARMPVMPMGGGGAIRMPVRQTSPQPRQRQQQPRQPSQTWQPPFLHQRPPSLSVPSSSSSNDVDVTEADPDLTPGTQTP